MCQHIKVLGVGGMRLPLGAQNRDIYRCGADAGTALLLQALALASVSQNVCCKASILIDVRNATVDLMGKGFCDQTYLENAGLI